VDLLDRIREEAGDQAQTDRMGLLKPDGWEASSLLLARLPSSREHAKAEQLASIFHPKRTLERLAATAALNTSLDLEQMGRGRVSFKRGRPGRPMRILIIPTFLLLASGCAGWGGSPGGQIRNVEWRAIEIGGRAAVETQRLASMELGGRNQASGSGGCNRWWAEYRLDPGRISFGQINSTRIGCEGRVGEQENIFFAVLNEADRYTVWRDGSLTIATPAGRTITFRRAAAP
jgi:heat shock protein HslJ